MKHESLPSETVDNIGHTSKRRREHHTEKKDNRSTKCPALANSFQDHLPQPQQIGPTLLVMHIAIRHNSLQRMSKHHKGMPKKGCNGGNSVLSMSAYKAQHRSLIVATRSVGS